VSYLLRNIIARNLGGRGVRSISGERRHFPQALALVPIEQGEFLIVPYEAGLGINDVLTCGGPGYTIDDLTNPPHGIAFKVRRAVRAQTGQAAMRGWWENDWNWGNSPLI
jgi:hypothetical protein